MLADYYNVAQAIPNFAADYTANKTKYATTPAAMAGFSYLQEGFKKGWYQKDFATTKFEQGLKLLADGKVAQYPMLSFALSTIATNSPDEVNDIGFFGQPGTDASKNGATIWMPAGTYIPKTSKNIDEAKDFLAFIASTAGVDAITAKVPPQGPYLIKGHEAARQCSSGREGHRRVHRFRQVRACARVPLPGEGTHPRADLRCRRLRPDDAATASAANYDKDVEKQAKQLGLPGW